MIISGMMWDMVSASVLMLTPMERWAAARRLTSRGGSSDTPDYWFSIVAVVVLIVLTGLLWRVTKKRKAQTRGLSRELFTENAARRGLSARERQILLAIVLRSGVIQSHDIFTTVGAFDRGAAKLLAECLRTRTADENERLKTEVGSLREKLGFQVLQSAVGPGGSRRPSSHDIPVGSILQLTRRHSGGAETIPARVIRNDDIELAVELRTPVETHQSDAWRARYCFGMWVWEFDTTAVDCDRTRLVLNHNDHVRFVNRRRFPRVVANVPALVAHFPLIRSAIPGVVESEITADRVGGSRGVALDAPVFVPGVVTELAGPGLRIETAQQIRAGDRVIVAFELTRMAADENDGTAWAESACIVESIGQVRHCRSISGGASFAVELTGLSETDIDTLVRITNLVASRITDGGDESVHPADQKVHVAAGNSAVVQEV